MKTMLSARSLARAAIAVSTIMSLGTPAAFAAKNQNAVLVQTGVTRVNSSSNSFALGGNSVSQSGGGNKNAIVGSTVVSSSSSTVVAGTFNSATITQK
jgi:hypothetical protein